MNSKLITVIIPIYNSAKFLERTLDCLKSQVYTEFEALLINDGSTEDSGLICDRYATEDCRFIVITKENGGVSSARNLGIQYEKGDYLNFVDSDDSVAVNCTMEFFRPMAEGELQLYDAQQCDAE